MSHPLRRLSRSQLVGLAEALGAGRLNAPYSKSSLANHVPEAHLQDVRDALGSLDAAGMGRKHVATMLSLLAEERAAAQRMSDRVQLVWSPPELDHVDARDTGVVVQNLFRDAKSEVLVVSYALDSGSKAEALFATLAERLDALPDLSVIIVANVHRKHGDETPARVLVKAFAAKFRDQIWPGERLPDVYYDPRSVEVDGAKKAVLHAKCVVVDGRKTLLTSANFTEAAQERNIEAGVLIDDRRFAERMRRQIDRLVEAGSLRGLLEGA